MFLKGEGRRKVCFKGGGSETGRGYLQREKGEGGEKGRSE